VCACLTFSLSPFFSSFPLFPPPPSPFFLFSAFPSFLFSPPPFPPLPLLFFFLLNLRFFMNTRNGRFFFFPLLFAFLLFLFFALCCHIRNPPFPFPSPSSPLFFSFFFCSHGLHPWISPRCFVSISAFFSAFCLIFFTYSPPRSESCSFVFKRPSTLRAPFILPDSGCALNAFDPDVRNEVFISPSTSRSGDAL